MYIKYILMVERDKTTNHKRVFHEEERKKDIYIYM
jgi:hypothetical protein